MATARTSTLGPASRPVAVPADLADVSVDKARGRVELPLHIRWSGPRVTYDLDDRADRARVFEQVLREGTKDDVRFYVDCIHLLELWDDLVLPSSVRAAWASWIEDRRRTAFSRLRTEEFGLDPAQYEQLELKVLTWQERARSG